MEKITIFDTTLRDGAQGTAINFTLQDKLEITERLDAIGIDYIEGGFPLASEKEAAFFDAVKKNPPSHAKIVAFGSTRRPGGIAKTDPHIQALINAETPVVVVVAKGWDAHVTEVIGTTLEENLEMVRDSITFLKREGREVICDIEHYFDGVLGNNDYSNSVIETAREAGADWIVLCDTNGGTLPDKISEQVTSLKQKGFDKLGIHCHNDTGCAVACSLAAIQAGALQVQGTINGWGERCGNANLCSIIPNIELKCEGYTTSINTHLSEITSLSRFAAEKANVILEQGQPYVGSSAFTHKGGQHADVIEKAPMLMEHIESGKVGNERHVLLSELAGKSTIARKIRKYGDFDKNSLVVKELINLLKRKEGEGYEYEAAEASFDLIVRQVLGRFTPLFELNNYHIEIFKTKELESNTVGRTFVRASGVDFMGAGVGDGPIDTLNRAIKHALKEHFSFLDSVHLIDYRVRVLNPESETAAKVRVFISSQSGGDMWSTVGVSANIVEASWQALADSYNYYYNNYIVNSD